MKKIRTYAFPAPDRLPLEERMKNAERLQTSDLRSVEARFREMGACPLSKYYKTEMYEDLLYKFLSALPYSRTNPLSPSTTYAEAAARIHELYEKGDVNQALYLVYLFLKPFQRKSVVASKVGFQKFLHMPSRRIYTLFVHEYAEVLDTLYPELMIDTYRYTMDLKDQTLFEVLQNNFDLYNHCVEDDYGCFDESLITGSNETKFYIIRELFIDPFYYLWTKDQEEKQS